MIFQNRDDLQELEDKGRVPREKMHLIRSSGVDTAVFRPGNSDMSISEKDVTVLMVARLTRQKGVEEFLQAASDLRKSHEEVEFVLGGEWSSHSDRVSAGVVERAVDRGDIRFIGYVENMAARLQSGSIFVFPSYYREGVPRVVLEAAACGLPVIAADVPGSREGVREGETGFLVPPRDPHALARTIGRLLCDAALRKEMGQAGRRMVEREFNMHLVTERQLDVYRQVGVLPRNRRSGCRTSDSNA